MGSIFLPSETTSITRMPNKTFVSMSRETITVGSSVTYMMQTPIKIGTIQGSIPTVGTDNVGKLQTPVKIGSLDSTLVAEIMNEETPILQTSTNVEHWRELERSTSVPEDEIRTSTEAADVSMTTTTDCCPEYAFHGSPTCYEYCDLAAQLAELMALLESYTGRLRNRRVRRRSLNSQMEGLILENLYSTFIELEECIQFSECSGERIKVVKTSLSGIIQSTMSMKQLSKNFAFKLAIFHAARDNQTQRALQRQMPYNCSLFERKDSLGEAPTVAACLAFKIFDTAGEGTKVCNKAFKDETKKLVECAQKKAGCKKETVFEVIETFLKRKNCVAKQAVAEALKDFMKVVKVV